VDTRRRPESTPAALARLYDLDLAEEPGDVELYRALAQRTGGPIIELGVGTGRIAAALLPEASTVVGVDDDPAMLARAGKRAPALQLIACDMVAAQSDPRVRAAGPYRLAILGLNSILLLASAERQRAVIHGMAELLAPGGIAVLDVWQPSPTDLVAFDGRLSLEWLRSDPETGREVTKTVAAWFDSASRLVTLTTIFDEGLPGEPPLRWTRTDALRLLTVDELSSFTEGAGLVVEQLAGDHELRPLEPGSDRVVLVARRPEAPRTRGSNPEAS
jgi:SAM-dependent methyltransferase